MIYRSNVTCPDLAPHFRYTVSRPMPHSYEHDVISDWADKGEDDATFGLYKKCGFWTHDEAAILYATAKSSPGKWLDIGAHTGWTMAHLLAAGCDVVGIEPFFALDEWRERTKENLQFIGDAERYELVASTSLEYATHADCKMSGIVIDGDHDKPWPALDAEMALTMLGDDGLVLFHDAIGAPVQDAVHWLMEEHDFSCRIYYTPHVVACCWRGDFTPPHHEPDARVKWATSQYLGELNACGRN